MLIYHPVIHSLSYWAYWPLPSVERNTLQPFFCCCRFWENYLKLRFQQVALPGNIYLHILATRAPVRSRQYTWMVFWWKSCWECFSSRADTHLAMGLTALSLVCSSSFYILHSLLFIPYCSFSVIHSLLLFILRNSLFVVHCLLFTICYSLGPCYHQSPCNQAPWCGWGKPVLITPLLRCTPQGKAWVRYV